MLGGSQSMSRYFFYIVTDLCVAIDGVWIEYWIYCIHHSELHFICHWHTQSSVLSLLQSPLAVSWQRFLPKEILQLHALRSSCHSRPCRTLFNWQLNQLGSRLAAISHQHPSLLFTGWLSTNNWQLSHSPTSYFTSVHSSELLTTLTNN
jgi:hypothetical protein